MFVLWRRKNSTFILKNDQVYATLEGDELILEMKVINHGEQTRDLVVWSLAAVSLNTKVYLPFNSPANPITLANVFPKK